MEPTHSLTPFESLPEEAKAIFFSFLKPSDLALVAQLSKKCLASYEEIFKSPSFYNCHKLTTFAALNDAKKIIDSLEENIENLLALYKLVCSKAVFVLAPSVMIQFADIFKTRFSDKTFEEALPLDIGSEGEEELFYQLKSGTFGLYYNYCKTTPLDNDLEQVTQLLWDQCVKYESSYKTYMALEMMNDFTVTYYAFLYPKKAIDTKNKMTEKYREIDVTPKWSDIHIYDSLRFITDKITAEELEETFKDTENPSYKDIFSYFRAPLEENPRFLKTKNIARFCFISAKLKESDIEEAIACANNMEDNVEADQDVPDEMMKFMSYRPNKDEALLMIAAYIAKTNSERAMEMIENITDPFQKNLAEKIVRLSSTGKDFIQVRKDLKVIEDPIEKLTTLLAFATTQS